MKLERLVKGRVVFVGVGNELRGDDGIGVYIAKKLKGKKVINAGVAPENFIGKIKKLKPERIIIFDALDFGGKPGEVRVVDARKTEGLKISTHSLPPSFFCKLFEGVEVYLVGIQPKGREFGASLTREVIRSADELLSKLTASSLK